jgi:hypothetical protein
MYTGLLILILLALFFNIKVVLLILFIISLIHLFAVILFYEKVQPLVQRTLLQSSSVYIDKYTYILFSIGANISSLYGYFKINPNVKFNFPEIFTVVTLCVLAIIVTKVIDKTEWNLIIKVIVKCILYFLIAYAGVLASLYFYIFTHKP